MPCNYLDYSAHNFAIDTLVDFTIATTRTFDQIQLINGSRGNDK